jgi:hypothetical protein
MNHTSINHTRVVFINLTEMDHYNGLEENLRGGVNLLSRTDMSTRFSTSGLTTESVMDIHLLRGILI